LSSLISGGGGSAVAASAHAACERFRRTDPLLTGVTRRALARQVGFPDSGGRIPEARWVRAMTFERLVHADAFVSQLLTRAVGLLGLDRPKQVRRYDGGDSVATTLKVLGQANLKAKFENEASMITRLAIPFLDLEDDPRATPIRPDFAIVCPREVSGRVAGSWLIMGDAKDYERVRSRIDDVRILKGFLQVALGAESAARWTKLPKGMEVHQYGALAVPRNVYLRPEAIVEDLSDHRAEVRARADERLAAMRELKGEVIVADELLDYVSHVEATFDPRTCSTCNLFGYCRDELRRSNEPGSLLIEIGVDMPTRPAVLGLVDGSGEVGQAPARVIASVRATVSGLPEGTGRRRIDPVGLPGSINVVLLKSDSAALGVHGIALQRIDGSGDEPWEREAFLRTNENQTRHRIMDLVGAGVRQTSAAGHHPVHIAVPDPSTADVLVSIADSLAGVELSRLRWARDEEQGRPLLTFDGEPATMPTALSEDARLAVSFLLEEDRARALTLRRPVVNIRETLANHVVAGGPAFDAGRLDYLLTWAEATTPLDHRAVSDAIADSYHTPGARLSTAASDALHREAKPGEGDEARYRELVDAALDYRIDVVERTLVVLAGVDDSKLRQVHRRLEADSQEIWGRRRALEAFDLVRFGLTYRWWRNAQVDILEADVTCAEQVTALGDVGYATDRAKDAGVRQLAMAEVVGLDPLRLDVKSRRLGTGKKVVALHVAGRSVVEEESTTVVVNAGAFKLGGLSIGVLAEDDEPGLLWTPAVEPTVAVGDEIVLADAEWFKNVLKNGHELNVGRPSQDSNAAPKRDCTPTSYETDPAAHLWCCRPHAHAEAERADDDAARRERGELNPQTWPPIVDEERFDIATADDEISVAGDTGAVPDDLTMDDLE
jgi:hypothetical protein